MNIKKAVASTALVAATAGISPIAFAQQTGPYVGASLGQTKVKDGCTELTGALFVVASCDDKDTAWKIFGGYQFNRNLGVEVGYTELGKITATGTVLGVPFSAKGTAKGLEVLGVATFPINEQFAVYGKAGLFRWDADASVTVNPLPPLGASDKGTDLTYGLGLKYNFTKNVAARLEWQRYNDVGDDNTKVNVIGAGLVFKF